MNNQSLKDNLAHIFLTHADLVEYFQRDNTKSKCLLIRIPYRSLAYYQKVSEAVVEHLEKKFNWPALIVAERKIVSKRGIFSLTDLFVQPRDTELRKSQEAVT